MSTPPTSGRWARIQELFQAALEQAPDARAAYLQQACGTDPGVHAEVVSLLDAHEDPGPIARLLPESPATLPLDRIGPYRILAPLGEGGMATVYLAEREGPDYTQLVALKISRTGGADARLADRLRGERRILAGLEHPNIARLVDGGATSVGQPFCAMEFVDGPNLLDYADRQRLTVAQRLELFLEVCDAVHYAHQQLVVHRDLKPSNILVSPEGRAKLLDFGIAKLLDAAQEVDPSILTHTVAWFTPAYASPEQVRGEQVTTLTDVYALGVVLYELLAGARPYDVDARSPAEIERIVCDRIPDPPSTAAGRASPEVAQARRSSAERLRRQIAGDLDTIVLKALGKEPARRYASVEQLAEDLRRYLHGHPVLARPDRFGYRAGKFVRRHRTAVAAATLAALSLIGGITAVAWQAARARRERDRAARALVEARQALSQSEDVTGFLLGLFRSNDPSVTSGNLAAARELLRRGVTQADSLAGQPAVQARMLDALGDVYANLGEYDESRRLLERALALRRATLGEQHVDVAQSLNHLGTLARRLANYAAAESLYLSALAIERRALGDSDLAVARTLSNLGFLMPYVARLAEGEAYYRSALAITRRVKPAGDPDVAKAVGRLCETLARRGKRAEAESLLREVAAARRRTAGQQDPTLAETLLSLADLIATDSGRITEAESLYRQALAIQRRTFGDRSPVLSHALDGLSDVLAARGAFAEAEGLEREVLDIRREALGAEHPSVAEALGHLAALMERQGRYQEALTLRRRALALWRRSMGPEHPVVAGAMTDVAVVLTEMNELDEAERLFRTSLAMRERTSGPDHPVLAFTLRRYAELRIKRRDYAGAEAFLLRALDILRKQLPAEHLEVRVVNNTLAELYDTWGRPEDARRYRAAASLAPPGDTP
ncbi:MAG TPA: serine/threonine-protein kinase [Gemmatimonadales bacterium]|nr:serine/threonine-protein kinase [Gemmatimonadales bacterium]